MSDNQSSGQHPEYWATLSEYHHDAEYQARAGEEFYPEAKPEKFFEAEGEENALMTPVQRRTFLKMSGFAALAATLAGCERPVQRVLPYVNRPEEVKLGHSSYYASTCTECAAGCGLLVETREGRPIKLEGNPDHPMNQGSLCSRGQGSIMSLYDPDRLRYPARLGPLGGYELDQDYRLTNADLEIGQAIRAARGKVVLLTRTVNGPSDTRLIREFMETGDNFEHVVYDPLVSGEERRANEATFGEAALGRYRFERAEVVLCLGGDPLAQSASPVEVQRGFAAQRVPSEKGMSRVYVFEPSPTLTGANADYRFATRPDHLLLVGLAIAHQLIIIDGQTRHANDNSVRNMLDKYAPATVAQQTGIPASEFARVARSLAENIGRSIVYTHGAAAQTQDAYSLHLLANFLNSALGNYEQTIDLAVSPSRQAQGGAEGILQLIEDMRAGNVAVLIFHEVNPVYTLPADAGFAAAIGKVPMVVSLNLRMDETTALAKVAVPAVHGLESWGDAEPQRGLFSIQQPTINVLFGESAANPLYATRAWQESLMAFMTAAGSKTFLRQAQAAEGAEAPAPRRTSWYDYVRETWEQDVFAQHKMEGEDFDAFWTSAVQLGVLDTVGAEARQGQLQAPSFNGSALQQITPSTAQGALQLVTQPSIHHGDGRSMSNPFLLEIPDPVSTVCWDNYAALAPAYAEEQGISEGDHLTVTSGDRSIVLPAFIQPGQHPQVVSIMLGWGRNTFGGVGDGIGVNAYPLTGVTEKAPRYSGLPVTIEKISGTTRLASTQGHSYLHSPEHAGIHVNKRKFQPGEEVPEGAELSEDGKAVYARPIIGDTTFNEWRADPYHGYPNHVPPHEEPQTIWERKHKYVGHHWGMSIDLNACNGCGACMVACHIENNVPVVGKDEIIKGREMFWIRIDRYYRGDKDNPQFAHMPLLCQHCDNAPCEVVCPVIATMHNDEGLNVMTYNRCVGTRYCANNCPYKVRRFNFWQYTNYRTGPYDDMERISPLEMVLNPDVTTRTRGVMEKCTFCLQRIRNSKEEVRAQGRQLEDFDLQVACQQTCPSKAIVFGDRNNLNSEVAQLWKNPRAYGLLADLTTDPSIRYQAIVRNRDEPSPYRTKYQDHRLHGDHAQHEAHEGQEHGHDEPNH